MINMQWLQLASLLADSGDLFAPADSFQGRLSANLGASARAGIQAENIKAERKRAEDDRNAGLFGKVGSTLGTLVGVAAAPFTGGTSMMIPVAMGAGGSLIGGMAGRAAGGGKTSFLDAAIDLGTGATGGFAGGRAVGLGMKSAGKLAYPMAAAGKMVPAALGLSGVTRSVTSPLSSAGNAAIAPDSTMPDSVVPGVAPDRGDSIGLGAAFQPAARVSGLDRAENIIDFGTRQLEGLRASMPAESTLPDISGSSVVGLHPAEAANVTNTLQRDKMFQLENQLKERAIMQRELEQEKDFAQKIKLEGIKAKNEKALLKLKHEHDVDLKREPKRDVYHGPRGELGVTEVSPDEIKYTQIRPGQPESFNLSEGSQRYVATGNPEMPYEIVQGPPKTYAPQRTPQMPRALKTTKGWVDTKTGQVVPGTEETPKPAPVPRRSLQTFVNKDNPNQTMAQWVEQRPEGPTPVGQPFLYRDKVLKAPTDKPPTGAQLKSVAEYAQGLQKSGLSVEEISSILGEIGYEAEERTTETVTQKAKEGWLFDRPEKKVQQKHMVIRPMKRGQAPVVKDTVKIGDL
jgi:hypothetical protein